MSGLIVFPTAMISSTPLWCTICTQGLCEGKSNFSRNFSQENYPGHDEKWLKQYCILDPKTVELFLFYFPYVLLFCIKSAFSSFFKANSDDELVEFLTHGTSYSG